MPLWRWLIRYTKETAWRRAGRTSGARNRNRKHLITRCRNAAGTALAKRSEDRMSEGPMETGTFLFTTLESRTTTGTPATEATTALRRHMTLLRRAVAAHGGEILPGSSPSALAARFATA